MLKGLNEAAFYDNDVRLGQVAEWHSDTIRNDFDLDAEFEE